MTADGFDDAVIGIVRQFNQTIVTYDQDKCIDILIKRDKMTHEEATEFFEFNVVGAYVGKGTPAFFEAGSLNDFKEHIAEQNE